MPRMETTEKTETSPETPSPVQSRRERMIQARKQSRETILMILLPVMFLFGLGIGWVMWGQDALAYQRANAPAEVVRRDVAIEQDDPILGPADAPVTIVEFSDYQCPFCERWYSQVYTRLVKEYEGKIRFIYRDFPLKSIHPEAEGAAVAANCAGEQNAYWQFHDALFSGAYGLGQAAYTQYATELGLDLATFNTCISDGRYITEIENDIQYGFSIGVSSTPSFYVNGIAVVGAQPYEVFKQLIDSELAAKAQD